MSWWESWFGEEYLDLYPHRDVESARREAAFALARLAPRPTPLLDLCCGSGRHSLRFSEAGIAPVALDYSAPLLELARRRDPRIRIVRGDMRSLPFPNESFRSVVNFFTSFGYFLRETENLAVVAEIERVLRDVGVFLCDTVGREWAPRAPRPGGEPQVRRQGISNPALVERRDLADREGDRGAPRGVDRDVPRERPRIHRLRAGRAARRRGVVRRGRLGRFRRLSGGTGVAPTDRHGTKGRVRPGREP
jgi:SAM-dependent methyltransferase